ncbi:MAG TPA: PadR family transcriptional regulator [Anaeromyxobacter sp.]
MRRSASPRRNGRHTPAFVLLFLSERPAHGAQLFARMRAELPRCFADSAGLYRSLQSLEREGSVKAAWEAPRSGAPRKVYEITRKGRAALRAFADDIRQREANFRFFLARLGSRGEA